MQTTGLNNEQILVIGFPAWEGEYLKSTVQLVSELAKRNNVLYVEYPFTWKDAIMGKLGRSKAPHRRILGQEQRLRSLRLDNGAEVNVLTLPPMLPVNFINGDAMYDLLMGANARRAHAAITSAMRSLGFHRPVVINAFNPFLGVFLARQFDEKALIYYCYDEISAANWANKHGERLERKFIRQADAVIMSSQPLFMAKKREARRSFLVKNGVDLSLFNQKNRPEAVEVSGSSQSPIGYLGSLDERIDYDLLESVIAKLPHRQFVFVGRINSPEADRLRSLPNVELVGSQPATSLPSWVEKFGVCMIPFLKNKLTAGIYPLKINEYFAMGKPVVATNFGDLDDFRHLVSVADNAEDFAKALEAALNNDQSTEGKHRIAFAHGNSWSERAAEMGVAIQEVVNENRALATSTDYTWMPDNYNRWGEGSAAFFNVKKESQEPFTLPKMAGSLAFS